METILSMIFMLLLDIALLVIMGILLFCIYFSASNLFRKNKSMGERISYFTMMLSCAFFIYGAAYAMKIFTNKTIGNPKPSNPIELWVNGEKMVQYHDITHLCNANDENSTKFSAIIPFKAKPSRKDICTICNKNYSYHNTPKEQHFFDAISEIEPN